MRRLVYISLVGLFLTGPTAANAAPAMEIHPPKPKPQLQLSEAQRQQVLQAVTAKNTDDKVPADFKPANGAKVPSQKKLPLHPLPQPLVYQVPALKQYYYAKLPSNVLIVDPVTGKSSTSSRDESAAREPAKVTRAGELAVPRCVSR